MRIAQVAPPFESVPPTHYGGTERVVSLLTEELVRRGHDVTLFASGDSVTSARLIPTVDRALWRQAEQRDPLIFWSLTLGEVYPRVARGDFDLVHSHLDFIALPCAALVDTPTVTTLHGRLDLRDLPRVYSHFAQMPVISISDSQREPLPEANWVGTVYNGVDLEQFPFNPRGGDYLVFLGRVSPEKGLDRAIRIARRAGLPIKVAARMPLKNMSEAGARADWDYYHVVVEPLLKEPDVEFVGEVVDAVKAELLGNARALLFPIDWPEPFGLVMAEAMACGTPVIARPRGSVPEVITDGVTGLIGETEDELVRLCGRVDRINRDACRAETVRRFSPQAMADGYELIFRRVLREEEAERFSKTVQAAAFWTDEAVPELARAGSLLGAGSASSLQAD
ncbi:MAG TPA: glycosyltransferase family 4 protein [Chloroflexota bacterium]|nr:glycosyltransferase family 4 protein [Chloroflexota bacterium]